MIYKHSLIPHRVFRKISLTKMLYTECSKYTFFRYLPVTRLRDENIFFNQQADLKSLTRRFSVFTITINQYEKEWGEVWLLGGEFWFPGGGARSTISKKMLLFKQEKVTIEDTILG